MCIQYGSIMNRISNFVPITTEDRSFNVERLQILKLFYGHVAMIPYSCGILMNFLQKSRLVRI